MIRFVVDPDGVVTPDVKGALPGRGMWVSADRVALEKAVTRKLFARSMRRGVTTPGDLVGRVEALLARRAIERLSLARRAGQAVAGYEKVRAALAAGEAAVLVAAADGAKDGRAKLSRLAAQAPIVDVLTRSELAEAFGRDDCVHVALGRGGLSEGFLREAARLAGVRSRPEGTR